MPASKLFAQRMKIFMKHAGIGHTIRVLSTKLSFYSLQATWNASLLPNLSIEKGIGYSFSLLYRCRKCLYIHKDLRGVFNKG